MAASSQEVLKPLVVLHTEPSALSQLLVSKLIRVCLHTKQDLVGCVSCVPEVEGAAGHVPPHHLVALVHPLPLLLRGT